MKIMTPVIVTGCANIYVCMYVYRVVQQDLPRRFSQLSVAPSKKFQRGGVQVQNAERRLIFKIQDGGRFSRHNLNVSFFLWNDHIFYFYYFSPYFSAFKNKTSFFENLILFEISTLKVENGFYFFIREPLIVLNSNFLLIVTKIMLNNGKEQSFPSKWFLRSKIINLVFNFEFLEKFKWHPLYVVALFDSSLQELSNDVLVDTFYFMFGVLFKKKRHLWP